MGVLALQGRTRVWLQALKQWRIWLTSLLLVGNWIVYVWLTVNARFIEASLGYFIVPLLNTLLGVRFFGEALRPFQKVAILLAALALLFWFAWRVVPVPQREIWLWTAP